MPDYRRNHVPGGTYFFTCVTHLRAPILSSELARSCLREAMEEVQREHPFEMEAVVLLPDHLHAVWSLPQGDARYPLRWMRIKEEFTKTWLSRGGEEGPQSASRLNHRHRGVWQRRYWEHTVRNEDDLKRCVDYIHWNPCKHRLVAQVCDWEWSSFHRYVTAGEYTRDWGRMDPVPDWDAPEWGGEL